jgi:sarcosine oxidase
VLGWFQPRTPELFEPASFPVFNLEVDEGRFYGLPVHGVPGFKVGRYGHRGERGRPDQLMADPGREDERLLREFVERYFPDGAGRTCDLKRCMFTNTPDEHFLVDLHPEYEQVAIASPCSGHGFKFAAVMGEILADLVTTGTTEHDIGAFALARFE